MIDFHSHIDLYPDPSAVVKECMARKTYVLSVTTTPSAWRVTSSLAKHAPRIRTALGLHPQLAHQRLSELDLFDALLGEVGYVGEIGLDGSPEYKKYWQEQLHVFTHILRSCERAGGFIMSIHSRRAISPILELLEKHSSSGIPVLHWFSGNKKELKSAVDLGCWFSVGPAMLLAKKGQDIANSIPRNKILTETDGPFAQLDGTSAMPWDVDKAISTLSLIWGIPTKDVEAQLSENLRALVDANKHR
jgi:TatD DNase family protein